MTLDELLLEKIANWRPDSTRPTLSVDDNESGWRVHLSADTVDQLGSRLHAVEVRRLRPLEESPPLAEQAAELASRVTGLLEPLRVVETDTSRGIAQLRSAAASTEQVGLRYYEVLRHADGTTSLHRYEANGGPRQAVPFTLTHEALAKFLRDVTQ
jgi:hypothetical protein